MSISSIVVRGFGSFGGVNLIPTLGYTIPNFASSGRAVASAAFVQGAQASAGFVQGCQRSAAFVQGAQASKGNQ